MIEFRSASPAFDNCKIQEVLIGANQRFIKQLAVALVLRGQLLLKAIQGFTGRLELLGGAWRFQAGFLLQF